MMRTYGNGIFMKTPKICRRLGTENFYYVQLSVIISMFVEGRFELGRCK